MVCFAIYSFDSLLIDVLTMFQVKEIYSFTQDDLTTEDVLVLDCHNELYVWVGSHSKAKSKEQALTFALVNYPF